MSLGAVAPSGLAAVPSAASSAAAVATIGAITPSPYLGASDTLTVVGTTSAATDTVAVALTPTTVPATPVTTSATVAANKSWTATFTKTQLGQVTDGTVTVTATSTEAGTAGTPATKTFVKDTTVPVVSTSAVSPALMGATSAGVVATVSGTVTASSAPTAAGEAGDQVTISADDTSATTAPVTGTVVTGQSGTFTTTLNTATLSDGTITYTYVARDPAGNQSPAVTTTNTKDTDAPAAPTVSVSPDPIANSSKTAVTVSGSAAGATVAISISDGTNALTSTATVSSGSYSKSAIDVSSLKDGTLVVGVTTADSAGNTSAATSKEVVKDTTAPTTTLEVPAFITAANTAETPVSGVSEPGATISVRATGTATVTGSKVVPADGHWSLILNTSTLAQGTVTFTATATDAPGNASAAVTKTSTKDTLAPEAPATVTASPSPYSTGTFTVAGTTSRADSMATITVDVTITDVLGRTLVSANQPVTPAGPLLDFDGSFSVPFGVNQMATLAEGALTVSAVFRDPAGNGGPARTVAAENGLLKLVSTNPAKDSTIKPPAAISATYNQILSSAGTGTTSTITVKDAASTTIAGTTAIVGTKITFTPTATLPAGAYTVTVNAVDKMYTTVTSTDTFSFTADPTAPPVAPTILVFTTPVTQANKAAVIVSGTADETGEITVKIANVVRTATPTGADKAWSTTFDLSAVPDGTLTASATQSDGSRTSAAATRTSTKDAAVPTKVSSVPSEDATVTSLSTVSVTFSENLATSGTIAIPGVTGTSVVDGKTVTLTAANPLADGTYTATATVADLVGNPGTGTVTFTVDSTPPKTASAVTLGSLPGTIVFGKTITLKGRVTQSTPSAYGQVIVRAITADKQVVDYPPVNVASDGTWSRTIKPVVNATFQVGYLGDSANDVSVSSKRKTNVAARVTASSARSSHTRKATVTGTVTPSTRSTVVTLYRISKSGAKVRLGSVAVGANRRFSLQVSLPKGTTKLVAVVRKTTNNAAGSVTFKATRT